MFKPGRKNTNLKYLNGFDNVLNSVDEKYIEVLKLTQCKFQERISDLHIGRCSDNKPQGNETRMYQLFSSKKINKLSLVPSHFINKWRNLSSPDEVSLPPFDLNPNAIVDFVQGIHTICGANAADKQSGLAIHIYLFNTNMQNKSFCNKDGDFLIVPLVGVLFVTTEFGKMTIYPGEVGVIQRGMHFKVDIVRDDNIITHRGYILEVFNSHFKLPTNNGNLVKAEHFQVPVAALDDEKLLSRQYEVYLKIKHILYKRTHNKSPFNVVMWDGNYYPYKYNLSNLKETTLIGYNNDSATRSVLICPSVADFVIFSSKENIWKLPENYQFVSEFTNVFCNKGLKVGSVSLRNISQQFKPNYNSCVNPDNVHTNQTRFMFGCSFNLSVAKWAVDVSKKGINQKDSS